MSKETMEEMRERIRREKEAAKAKHQQEIVTHLTHEEPDYAKIAEDLQRRHEEEAHSLNDRHVKETIYIQEDIAKAFNALCLKRGDKKKFINQALADFVTKKHRELQVKKTD